jgi:hypothetical protein
MHNYNKSISRSFKEKKERKRNFAYMGNWIGFQSHVYVKLPLNQPAKEALVFSKTCPAVFTPLTLCPPLLTT